MVIKVRYHPLFDVDLVEASDWYDDRSPGLGDAFVANVRIATEAAISAPLRFGRTSKGLRYVRVKRFPYIVLFELRDEELLFLGVLHTARSIEKWRRSRQ